MLLLRSIFLLAATTLGLVAAPLELHLSPQGQDSASGTAEASFATLQRARDEIRRLRPAAGATVFLHSGTYHLASALDLTQEDSGTEQAPITYRAAPGEKPVLSGGLPITGLKP
jgi:hypothetical protein